MSKDPILAEKNDAGKETNPTNDRITRREIIVGIIAVLFTIGLGVVAIIYKDVVTNGNAAASYGLIGIVIVSFLAGSILSFTAIPIPYWFLVITLPTALAVKFGLLAPVFVALSSAFGSTVGHMPTFMIGYGGRGLSRKITNRFGNNWYGRWYQKLVNWSSSHGWIAVFLNSAIFNPVHLPMTIAFGTLHYPPWKFFIYSMLGNLVKALFLAFIGYFGLNSLLNVFGIK